MPCPFFEPRSIAQPATYPNARLPLIDEYDGGCHLLDSEPIDHSVRLRGCNLGNADAVCRRFCGSIDRKPILRFSVQGQQTGRLQVTVIEEQDHTPQRWQLIEFRPTERAFEPELADVCQRAQLLAFCSSYLARSPL